MRPPIFGRLARLSTTIPYDAARKAVAADMAAGGYRARSDRPGAHAAVVAYAQEALAHDASTAALDRLDRMRRIRNRAEYGGVDVSSNQARSDLVHADEIVAAVARRVAT